MIISDLLVGKEVVKNKEKNFYEKRTKNRIATIFAFLISAVSYAQFAKIVDKDDYVNVRSDATIKSDIKGIIKSDEIVFTFADSKSGNWITVSYTTSNDKFILSGYVHTSRIKYLSSYLKIPNVSYDEFRANFKLETISVSIQTEKFNAKKNKKYFSIAKDEKNITQYLYKGQQVWGVYKTIPENNYKAISVLVNGKQVKVPNKEFENLFNISNEFTKCYYDKVNDVVYIIGSGADGAESYLFLFKIEKGIYKGRKVIRPF